MIRILDLEPSSSKDDRDIVIQMTYRKLATFLHEKFNASMVLDGNIPQEISLVQSAIEFCTRYRHTYMTNSYNEQPCTIENKHDSSWSQLQPDHFATNYNEIDLNLSTKTPLQNITTDIPSISLSATSTRYLIRPTETKSESTKSISDNNYDETFKIEGVEIQHSAGIDPSLDFLHPQKD